MNVRLIINVEVYKDPSMNRHQTLNIDHVGAVLGEHGNNRLVAVKLKGRYIYLWVPMSACMETGEAAHCLDHTDIERMLGGRKMVFGPHALIRTILLSWIESKAEAEGDNPPKNDIDSFALVHIYSDGTDEKYIKAVGRRVLRRSTITFNSVPETKSKFTRHI